MGVALPSFLCLLINMMSAFQYFCFYILFVWVGGCLKSISVLTYREPGLLTCDNVFHWDLEDGIQAKSEAWGRVLGTCRHLILSSRLPSAGRGSPNLSAAQAAGILGGSPSTDSAGLFVWRTGQHGRNHLTVHVHGGWQAAIYHQDLEVEQLV